MHGGAELATPRRPRVVLVALGLALVTLLATYAVSLGTSPSGAAKARMCFNQPATKVGTKGDNRIVGTPGPDVIVALAGNDRINGKGGKDKICAGPGNDIVHGGGGDDKVSGGNAGDLLLGEGGADKVFGNGGDDALSGGKGKPDLCSGGKGRDLAAKDDCEKIVGAKGV